MTNAKLNKVIIRPVGGLANRMRAIEASYNYASAFGAKLLIFWERNNILNADYEQCFEPVKGAELVSRDHSGYDMGSKLKRKYYAAHEKLLNRLSSAKYLSDMMVKAELDKAGQGPDRSKYFDRLALVEKEVYIETCYDFYPAITGFEIKVKEEIRKDARLIVNDTSSTTGIHIRQTDNVLAIKKSPLELFEQKIEQILEQNPDSLFFLSTDADEVVNRFQNKYGDNIKTGATERRRDSDAGIRSALIDLCCLSYCRKIYGSFYSSFSERAARMGGIPLEILALQKEECS